MVAEPHVSDELEELRQILLGPEFIASRISPVVADVLREQAGESPEQLAEVIAPAVEEALRRQVAQVPENLSVLLRPLIASILKEQVDNTPVASVAPVALDVEQALAQQIQQDPEGLVAALRPLIADILKEQVDSSSEDLATAIVPAVEEALQRQIEMDPARIAATLDPIISQTVDRAIAEATKSPTATTDTRPRQSPVSGGILERGWAWLRNGLRALSGVGRDPVKKYERIYGTASRKWLGLSHRALLTSALLLILLVSVGGCSWWVWHVEHSFAALAMVPPTATLTLTATATATASPTATCTTTSTPSPTPTSSPTITSSPSPTARPLTLAVGRDVYALNEALFSLLPGQHERLVVLPYTSHDSSDDALATELASWAIHWVSQAPEGAVLLREEPYVVVAHPLLSQDELTMDELVALASGEDRRYKMVVGDSGKATCELLGLEGLPPDAIPMPGWVAAKEYVATHQDTWALVPWDAVDFRVRALAIEGIRPDPTNLDGYPLMRRLWLTQQVPAPQSLVDALVAALRYEPPATVELVGVGDVMLGRQVEEMIQDNTASYPFEGEGIQRLLSQADIAFANLECPISDGGTRQDKGYEFRADPEVVEALVEVGLDVLSLANNHTGDYGDFALTDTLRLLTGADLAYIGAGNNITEAHEAKIIEANGLRVAFLAYNRIGPNYFAAAVDSPGSAFFDSEWMTADVQAARKKADVVVVSCHWGIEYTPYPNAAQKRLAQTLADAGVDLILGHHPHVVQGLRYHQDTLTAYSLGNFVFDQGFSQETSEGLVLRCLLDATGVKTVELIPVYIVDCQPSLTSPGDGASVVKRILDVTKEEGGFPEPAQ